MLTIIFPISVNSLQQINKIQPFVLGSQATTITELRSNTGEDPKAATSIRSPLPYWMDRDCGTDLPGFSLSFCDNLWSQHHSLLLSVGQSHSSNLLTAMSSHFLDNLHKKRRLLEGNIIKQQMLNQSFATNKKKKCGSTCLLKTKTVTASL